MRGRRPSGPEMVDQLPGSDLARERVKVVLQTMAGELRVQEACEVLHLSEQPLRRVARAGVAGGGERVGAQARGRPPRLATTSRRRLLACGNGSRNSRPS